MTRKEGLPEEKMSLPRFLPKNFVCLLLCLLLFAGCATPVIPRENRDKLGRLGMATVGFAPEVVLDVTRGRGHGALMGAAGGASGSVAAGILYLNPFSVFVGVLLAPVAAVGGAVYGAIVADSADEVQKSINPIETLLHGMEFQQVLRQNVAEFTRRRTSQRFVQTDLMGSESPGQPRNLQDEKELDSVLEVGIREIRLQDQNLSNTRVVLKVTGFARLVRVRDGSLCLEKDYRYQSADRGLDIWAQHGGSLVKDELRLAYEQIAGLIVDDYFLPVSDFPQPIASLAVTQPIPETGFFTAGFVKPLATQQPVLGWQPFPSEQDMAGLDGERLKRASEIVYDLRIADQEEQFIFFRHDLAQPTYKPETPLPPCRIYNWQVRARFRVDEAVSVTPWISDKRNRFKTDCSTK